MGNSRVYTYNVGNQRTAVTRTGENTAGYMYDAIGQVTGDQASEVSGGVARLNEQLQYAFDPAGNLAYRTNNALIQKFQVNSVNELTANTNSGTLTVVGTTTSPATSVAVNGTSASIYGDTTFAAAGLPLTTTYTATASDSYGRQSTNSVSVNFSSPLTYHYDGNGNLTNDSLRSFAYDDENQLIQVWVGAKWMSQFTYDGKMRRRIRKEFTWQGGAWVQTNEVHYVYDGNLVIQERDINNFVTTTYTRGKDLSGSLEGAGGIGGLLARTDAANVNTATGTSYYHSDANGNVTMLIDGSQGIVAKYLYDAFGNLLSASGSMAQANLYRFSSKEWHQNSGLAYYLYRYYDPHLQRWPNRDPIGEAGGINLYGFVGNSPLSYVDPFGLTLYYSPDPFPGSSSGYGPYTENVNDGSDAVLPAVPYLTDSRGMQSTDADFLPVFLPEIPAVSDALAAASKYISDSLSELGNVFGCQAAQSGVNLAEGEAALVLMKDGQLVAQAPVGSMLSHAEFAGQNGALATDGSLAPGFWVGTVGKVNGQVAAMNSMTFYGNQLPNATLTAILRGSFH